MKATKKAKNHVSLIRCPHVRNANGLCDLGRWNVVFDIPIPGWLPASSKFGIDELGTCYTLYATAKFINLDDSRTSSSWFTTLCSPFRSRQWRVNAAKTISVHRSVEPPSTDVSEVPPTTYLVRSKIIASHAEDALQIPADVIEKLQILASIPEYVDVNDDTLALTLRLRTKGLDETRCKSLRLVQFGVDVVQKDKCRFVANVTFNMMILLKRASRFRATPEYLTRYPVPGPSSQPPNVPLRTSHRLASIYDVGIFAPPVNDDSSMSRTFSLLPKDENGKYSLDGETQVFANDAENVDNPTWYTLQTSIPIAHCGASGRDEDSYWAGSPVLRPSSSGPLFGVRHEVRISLTCTYEFPDEGGVACETINFGIPLTFSRVAPSLPPRSSSPTPSEATDIEYNSSIPALPPLLPYAQNLPAYSQLFYSNGDRKFDATPLPLYTPRDSPSASTSTIDIADTLSTSTPSDKDYGVDDDAAETTHLLS